MVEYVYAFVRTGGGESHRKRTRTSKGESRGGGGSRNGQTLWMTSNLSVL